MNDQSKPKFSFGTTATTNAGASGGLFGQQSSAGQQQGSIFGSSNKPTATSGPSLFGSTTTAGGTSMFGGRTTAAQSSNIFSVGGGGGDGASKPTPSFSFGSLLGQQPSSAGPQPGIPASSQSFSTPNKAANTMESNSGQPSNPFGRGTSGLFQDPAYSAPGTTATPTSKPAFSFPPLGSTTPAEPPPSTQSGANNAFSLNLSNQQQEKKSLFPPQDGSTAASQAPSQTSSIFSQKTIGSGPGLFANPAKPQNSSTQPSAPTGGNSLFPNLGSQTSGGLAAGGQGASTSIFAKPAPSQASEAQKPTFSFPPASSQSSAQAAQNTQASSPSLFNLGAPSPATTSAPSANPFGSLTKPNESAKSLAPPTSGAPSSIFSSLGKSQEASSSSVAAGTTSSLAPASAPESASSIFGKLGQPASSAGATPSNPAAATSTSEVQGNASVAAGSTLGQSTSGPVPSAQSRLKNKSMDEIITRWASDLAKYQKDFQNQAEKVASWDYMLVENSEKIQKLYGSTLEAERAATEVERQITAVENDQNELESWLDRYEEKVDQMNASSGDSFHGPDLERERTYELITITELIV
ncbi:MAG: hypothetical protein Q9219_002282 [cf. Caloplaca sp. 3 TL-2023]